MLPRILIGNSIMPFSVEVDRTKEVTINNHSIDRFKFPNLQDKGPKKFDSETEMFLFVHPKQNEVCNITGEEVLDSLCKRRMIERCFNLQDGFSIKEKGIVFFQNVFENNPIFLFKSAFLKSPELNKENEIEVPYLYVDFSNILRIGTKPLKEKWEWYYYTPIFYVNGY
jgi:hypothetical protein